MIVDFLHQQLANVRTDCELQLRVVLLQRREDYLCNDALAGRHHVQAADPAQVRLDKAKRILPHGTDEIDHRVVAAEDRVVVAMTLPPTRPQPFVFFRSQPQQCAHREILHIQLRQALERVVNSERHVVDVRDLVGQHRDGARQDVDRLALTITQIDEVVAEAFLTNATGQGNEFRLGNPVERLAHPAGKTQTAQTHLFGGGQHDALWLRVRGMNSRRAVSY